LSMVDVMVRKSFKEHYAGGELDFGKNLLVVKVAGMFVTNFLQKEMEIIKKDKSELIILSLEDLYSHEINITPENSDAGFPVKFKGKCDRIDSLNGKTRVIDYKSGMVMPSELALKDWDLLLEGTKQDKIFQVLFYAYVFAKNQSDANKQVQAGIISFRNLSSGFMPVKTLGGVEIDDGVLTEFENVLQALTGELLDKKVPFSQTPNPDHCVYCPFVGICNR
ncbi:MAG: hypothetical protein DRJ05_10220, partial [Bacteroidetes bacterium]